MDQSKKKTIMSQLIVASNSPRRQQLMKDAGFDFEIRTLEIDESVDTSWPTDKVAMNLSVKKNEAYRHILDGEVVLTADTVVVANNQILGKPKDPQEAKEMILAMSDSSHQVITGVAISSASDKICFDDVTTVQFKKLTSDEVSYYIKNFQPFDKAGSYGIQEWIGMIGIKSIQGSFYNVMGLPIHKVYDVLSRQFGISPIH